MKLYFHPLSGSSRRVLLAATQLDVPLERIVIDLPKGEQRSPAHKERNPNGRVPVLEDDGFVLWESRAIMLYLAEKTPGQTLLPNDPRERADVQRWLFFCAAHMGVANTILVQENFVKPLGGRTTDPSEVARGEALFAASADVLDAALTGRKWLVRDCLSLADFSIAASFALAGPAKFPIAKHENILAWMGRIRELDAWKRTDPPRPA